MCGGAAACARGSPRARNPRGRRIRNLAGGDSEPEQSRLRSRSCCTARHSHRTPSSLDGQEEHHRAHMRLACGGAGQRWFFLALNWQGSSPLTQRKHSPAPSRQCRHTVAAVCGCDQRSVAYAFVVCERRPLPSTDGGNGRHLCRCESRACHCVHAAPSSLPPSQSLPPVSSRRVKCM